MAFRCAYSDAFACISTSDPQLTIVNLLYSSGMVDRATRDDATDPRKQSMDNVRYLLAQLERHIEKCPEFYHKTVALLEQADSCYLNQLAMLWKTSFGKLHQQISYIIALYVVHVLHDVTLVSYFSTR